MAIVVAAAMSTIIASYAYFTKHIDRAVAHHARFGIEHSFRTAEQVALLRNEFAREANRWLENFATNAREITLVRRDVEWMLGEWIRDEGNEGGHEDGE